HGRRNVRRRRRSAFLLQQVGARHHAAGSGDARGPLQGTDQICPPCQPARARANVVLDNLVDAGFMTEGQVFGARRNPASVIDRRNEDSPNYYLDYAFDEVQKIVDTFPKSYNERVFVVRTAIDMNVQKAADEAVENELRQYGRDYHATQAAVVIADLTGGVRA